MIYPHLLIEHTFGLLQMLCKRTDRFDKVTARHEDSSIVAVKDTVCFNSEVILPVLVHVH